MRNLDKVLLNTYKELYLQSTPSADFDELMKTCSKNKLGQIEIPYNDYEIEEELFNKILVKNSKGLSKFHKQILKTTVVLGCSPKFKNK
jgi:hypothetical protein